MEYFTGRVYKIQIKDDFKKSANMLSLEQKEFVDNIYIGSTKNSLKKRFKHHKQISKNNCTTYIFAELFGPEYMEIILIKEYIVFDEKHLYMYETLHMNKCRLNHINLINKQASFRIEMYYAKDYRLKHLEEKKVINKNYYKNNTEYFKNHNDNYYIKNKNKFKCEICNLYFHANASREEHYKTKNHRIKAGEIELEYTYKCKYCNIYSNDKQIFVKHIKSEKHIDLKLTKDEEYKIYKFRFECIPCNFKDDSLKDYETHLGSKKHREIFNIKEEFKFKCEPCKYYQNQEKLFKRHLKSKKHELLSNV
jgi:Pyruvate/2-oxoacid:ferredoxin oxidoreductase delta subunit